MNNKILFLAAMALLAFACGKTEYPEYEWGPQDDTTKADVFFTRYYEEHELDPDVNSVVIELKRRSFEEALSVSLVVTDTAGVFAVPETADFIAGDSLATVTVDVSRLEVGVPYGLGISIPAEYFNTYRTTQTTYFVKVVKQKWNSAGTCTFYDCYSYYEDDWAYVEDVPIQQLDGENDFRIIAPYVAMFPANTALEPVNILFSLVLNTNKKPVNITFSPKGLWHLWADSIYDLYWDSAKYGQYCYAEHSYDSENDCHRFDVHVLGANLSTGALGTWGRFAFEWYDCPVDFPKE